MRFSSAGGTPGLNYRFVLSSLILVCISTLNIAWAIQEHEGEVFQIDEKLSLSFLLASTLKRHPQAIVLKARSETMDAETRYGNRWLPESTRLTAFHMSDRSFDDTGVYENEVALSIPIWLPGEKDAQSRLGEILAVSQVSGEANFRWRVSGQLRQQLWQVRLAVRQWQLAYEQEQRLGEVLEQVSLFADAGELSRADLLATMEELAVWKGETILLEAEYMDAIRLYRSFTGLEVIPAQIDETLSTLQEVKEDHPALRQAMNRMAEASAFTEVVRQRSNHRPSLDIFWRGFRGDTRSPDVNALGIGFAMPIGKSPRREPEVAKANEEFARAEADLLETKRELNLQLHEANHALNTSRERLENSDSIMSAATERYQLDKLAFELGEFSTSEWLRRLSQFKKIEQSHELLLIQQGAAVAAYNQAVGETL